MESSREYQRWRELHKRVARGDLLSVDERAVYEIGLRELDESETLGALQNAKNARKEPRQLEAESRALEARRRELDAEIAKLENSLAPRERELLGVEE